MELAGDPGLIEVTREAYGNAIFRLMEDRPGPADVDAARAAVADLRDRRVNGVVLGCTELPLLLGPGPDGADAPDLLNPADLLAEAAVSRAVGPA